MNKFAKTVSAVPDIANGYRLGLGALGADSNYVAAAAKRSIDGSVNIDCCTKEKYPEDHRWDYVISYCDKAYYLEVHPATDGEVKVLEAKLKWLKSWLRQTATDLDSYPSGTPKYTWVHSGKCGLTKGSREYKKAVMLGLVPKNSLALK